MQVMCPEGCLINTAENKLKTKTQGIAINIVSFIASPVFWFMLSKSFLETANEIYGTIVIQIAVDKVDGNPTNVLTIPEFIPSKLVAKILSNCIDFKMFIIKKLSITSESGSIIELSVKGIEVLKTSPIIGFNDACFS